MSGRLIAGGSALVALAAVAGVVVGANSPTGSPEPIAVDEVTTSPRPEMSAEAPALTVGTTSPALERPLFEPEVLERPGQDPPQFVVVSFDGACEEPSGVLQRYLDLGQTVGGRFSLNLGGLCLLPRTDARFVYQPPGRPAGTSDIGFARPEWVADRIRTWSRAYLEGHEIATHYLGHFCGPGGVQSWTQDDWTDEMDQFAKILDEWPLHNPQVTDQSALPFDASVIEGGRTPCLEGDRSALYPALAAAGHTYESSNGGDLRWPTKVADHDLWDFPLQRIKVLGYGTSVLSMDYNFLVAQNGGRTEADPQTCARIEESTYDSLMAAGHAVYHGNRAPLFIGSHFNDWACGAYMRAIQRFIVDFDAQYPEARFVSNADLVTWLEAQQPLVLAELQARPIQQY